MNKITFVSNNPNSDLNECTPEPVIKSVPDWYKKIKKYDEINNKKTITWKACPAILDCFSLGYYLKTPCDIEFYLNNDLIFAKTIGEKFLNFIWPRNIEGLPSFPLPFNSEKNHFAWLPNWGISVPEGYSVLYTHPMNRFDLPFFTTSGVVDNDKIDIPGQIPFFIVRSWSGIIPKGTPYVQIIPFERSSWESEYILKTEIEIYKRNEENSKKYRTEKGGVYKNEVWTKKVYR